MKQMDKLSKWDGKEKMANHVHALNIALKKLQFLSTFFFKKEKLKIQS